MLRTLPLPALVLVIVLCGVAAAGPCGEDFNRCLSAPGRRIDVVFERGLQRLTDVLVGTTDLTPSGLYPSDHAGVVAKLAIGS